MSSAKMTIEMQHCQRRVLSTGLKMNPPILWITDIGSLRTSTGSPRYMGVLPVEKCDHLVWTSSSSKLHFLDSITTVRYHISAPPKFSELFAKNSDIKVWNVEKLISWLSIVTTVFVDTVSIIVDSYSITRTAGAGGVSLTGHCSCIND